MENIELNRNNHIIKDESSCLDQKSLWQVSFVFLGYNTWEYIPLRLTNELIVGHRVENFEFCEKVIKYNIFSTQMHQNQNIDMSHLLP